MDTLAEHVPGLPEAARDFLNWIGIETDEQTGAARISWKEG